MRVDAVLKLSLAAGALMAGAGVGYYYAFFLPAQAIHETVAASEKHRSDSTDRDAAQERARLAETQRHEAAQQRYQSCVSSADMAYHGRWTAACRSRHARQEAAFEDCADDLFRTRNGCARDYPVEPEQGCALPNGIGDRLASARDAAKAQCLGEMQGGLTGL